MNRQTPNTPETNPCRFACVCLAVTVAALLLLPGSSDAIPFDGAHQAPTQAGYAQKKVTLIINPIIHLTTCHITMGNSTYFPQSATCQKPATDVFGFDTSMWAGRVLMGPTLTNPLSVIQGQVSAVDGAYYANDVDLSQHIAAPLHEIEPGASVTIHSAVSLIQPTTFVFRAPAGESAYAGMGRMKISGPLNGGSATNQIDIKGEAKQLPVTLITYTQISGTWRAGVIPPGTQVEITPRAIRLIRSKKK